MAATLSAEEEQVGLFTVLPLLPFCVSSPLMSQPRPYLEVLSFFFWPPERLRERAAAMAVRNVGLLRNAALNA